MPKNILPSDELNGLPWSRVSTLRNPEPIIIESKIINDEIDWNDRALYQDRRIAPLVFSGCEFNEIVNIGSNQAEGVIHFKNCIFNKSVKVKVQRVRFKDGCTFNENLELCLDHYSTETIAELDVNGILSLTGNRTHLRIKDLNNNLKVPGNINISVESSIIEIENADAVKFSVQFTNIETSVSISSLKASELYLIAPNTKSQVLIASAEVTKLEIKKSIDTGKKVSLKDSTITDFAFSTSFFEILSIVDCNLNNFHLSDVSGTQSFIALEKSEISNLKFRSFTNNGTIALRELVIPKDGVASFLSCNLGKADFIYCNFSKATLEFENSKITEAFFSETEFPKRVLVNGKTNYAQAQLVFGQLATAFQKQGDSVRASEYSSRELESHFRNISLFSRNFFEKLNLFLSFSSNNFGRSWARGVAFSFAVGLFIFCLLLISTNEFQWSIVPSIHFELLPAYLKFMNPLRFFELDTLFAGTKNHKNINLSELSYLSDFFGRVFVAYGYYQTIQAFRRFGKK